MIKAQQAWADWCGTDQTPVVWSYDQPPRCGLCSAGSHDDKEKDNQHDPTCPYRLMREALGLAVPLIRRS